MNAPLPSTLLAGLGPLTRRTRRLRLGLPSGTSPATLTLVPLAPEFRDAVPAPCARKPVGPADTFRAFIRALPPGYFPL
jgi:hypothetical protein